MNILEEADEITMGARQNAYGSPRGNAEQFAAIASAATGLEIKPDMYPILMICVKLARLSGQPFHRDSWVDVAGYARLAEMIHES